VLSPPRHHFPSPASGLDQALIFRFACADGRHWDSLVPDVRDFAKRKRCCCQVRYLVFNVLAQQDANKAFCGWSKTPKTNWKSRPRLDSRPAPHPESSRPTWTTNNGLSLMASMSSAHQCLSVAPALRTLWACTKYVLDNAPRQPITSLPQHASRNAG
jgi:hypothetical protein